MEKIVQWCNEHELDISIVSPNIVVIGDLKFLVITENADDILIDQDYDLLLSEDEVELLDSVDYIAFEFGGNFYYSPKDQTQLNFLKWIGKRKSIQNEIFPFLGIHSRYEIGAGTGEFDNWIAKAKFLNYTHLSICDEGTMGGMFAFQKSCKKHQLGYTLGASYMVEFDNHIVPFKIYIQNYEGWRNCLLINKAVNVDSEGRTVSLEQLLQLNKGLSLVITNDALKALISCPVWLNRVHKLEDVYFQVDFTQFDSKQYDLSCLNIIKQYLDKELFDKIPPVLISDAYYIDKQDFLAKNIIENAALSRKKNQSKNQYLKHLDHILEEAIPLFSEQDNMLDFLINEGIENAKKIASHQFEIPTGVMRLPQYEMTDQEALKHNTNEDLFLSLISNAIERVSPEKQEQYFQRAEKEIEVIKMGGFIDYFLILYDLVNWSDKQGIERGFARGSAAGSLVSYLLRITLIDPIEYDLIFERFLNEARILKEVVQEVVVIELEDETLRFDSNQTVTINRNSEILKVLAKDINQNDFII